MNNHNADRPAFALIVCMLLMSSVLAAVGVTLYQATLARAIARAQTQSYVQRYAFDGLIVYALDQTRREWRTFFAAKKPITRELAWSTISGVPYNAHLSWRLVAWQLVASQRTKSDTVVLTILLCDARRTRIAGERQLVLRNVDNKPVVGQQVATQ